MVITYHELVDVPSPYLYAVDRALFAEQIGWLERQCRGDASPVLITFDDGVTAHATHGAPVLERAGFRGVFFVTTGWIGKAGYLNGPELRRLEQAGHSVQSHGCTHTLLTRCDPAELARELRGSKQDLEDVLGHSVDAISAPGGAWNSAVLRAAAEAGYRRFYVSDPWKNTVSEGGLQVRGRLMIRNAMTVEKLARFVEAHGRTFSWPRFAYMSRRYVRTILGEALYHNLWCFAARVRPDHPAAQLVK